jgi:hypothetical protein
LLRLRGDLHGVEERTDMTTSTDGSRILLTQLSESRVEQIREAPPSRLPALGQRSSHRRRHCADQGSVHLPDRGGIAELAHGVQQSRLQDVVEQLDVVVVERSGIEDARAELYERQRDQVLGVMSA